MSQPKSSRFSQERINKLMDKLLDDFPEMGKRKDGTYSVKITDVGFVIRQLYGSKGYGGKDVVVMFSTPNVKRVWNRMKKYYKSRGYTVKKSKFTFNTLLPSDEYISQESYKKRTSRWKGKGKSRESKLKFCPAGKILNPKSGRCVDINGPIGKKLRGKESLTDPDDKIAKLRKDCSKGKILNPSTGRCVNEDGKIGRNIIQSRQKLEIVSKREIIPIVISKAQSGTRKKIIPSRRKI